MPIADVQGSSSAASWLAVVAVAAVVTLVAAIVLGVRAGRALRRGPLLAAGVAAGLFVACVCLFGAGMLHYGGNTTVGENATVFRCQPWWVAIGSRSASSHCAAAARAAVLPAALIAAGAGVVSGPVVSGLLEWRRRRSEKSIRTLGPTPV
jgi:hypothetical protein